MVSLKMVTVVYNIIQILLVAYIILPLLMTNLNVVYKESFVLIKLATYSPAGCGWGPSLAYWTTCSGQLRHLEAKEEGLRGPPAPPGVLECRTCSLDWLHCLLLDVLGLLDRVCDPNYSSQLLENAGEDLLFVLTGHQVSIIASRHPGTQRNRDGKIYNPSFEKDLVFRRKMSTDFINNL